MQTTYLLTGSNLQNRPANLQAAIKHIQTNVGKILSYSEIYETQPWGYTNQPNFLNQALAVQTLLEPLLLLQTLKAIEDKMGRVATERLHPRLIDIDILLYGNQIITAHQLAIPHPALHLRRFALRPLAAIAPTMVHPILDKAIQTLLTECTDPLVVKKYTHAN